MAMDLLVGAKAPPCHCRSAAVEVHGSAMAKPCDAMVRARVRAMARHKDARSWAAVAVLLPLRCVHQLQCIYCRRGAVGYP